MTVVLNRRRGKSNERALAKRLKAKRVGILQGEDLEHPIFSFEVKERKKLPVFLRESYQQAVDNAPDDKIPIVVLHQLKTKHSKDLIIMALKDFEKIIMQFCMEKGV